MKAVNGFDNISPDKNADDLERWRLALDIRDVILSTPKAWSVRVGIFGPWGSGKSTLLRYVGDQFGEDIVIYFSPSFEADFSEAVAAFGRALVEELERRGLLTESGFKSKMRSWRFWQSKTTTGLIESSSELLKGTKLLSASLGALSIWLRHSVQEIQRISEKFPDKRFVVLIDDLDRTSADLLPRFLLSLRELFDLPQFAFVLGFDDAIVAEALKKINPEWEQGQDFLEKILDFRFSLPPVDEVGKRRILTRAIKNFAAFVPASSAEPIFDLISNNPREIKALVRGMLSIKSVTDRHGEGEFDWTDVWLVQLLTRESARLVEALLDEKVFNDAIGMNYRLIQQRGTHPAQNEPPDPLSALMEKAKMTARAKQRAASVVQAMRARGSFRLREVMNWSLRQPAITWKEFDQMVGAWATSPTSEDLAKLIRTHAEQRSEPLHRVEQEFIEAVSGRIDDTLSNSRGTTRPEQVEAAYTEVARYQKIADRFFEIPGALNPSRIKLFYDRAQFWGAVRRSPAEQHARAAERDQLIAWAQGLDEVQSVELYTELRPWARGFDAMPLNDGGVREALLNDMADVLSPRVLDALVAFLATGNSVRELSEPERFQAFKNIVFPISGPIVASVKDALMLKFSSESQLGYENCDSLVALFLSAIRYWHPDISADQVKNFVSDRDLLERVWFTLRSRPLLPQGVIRLLVFRHLLIEAGLEHTYLPLDEQLETQVGNFEQHRASILDSIRS